MYYYGIVDDYCQCTSVVSSDVAILDNHYVEISEEEFTSQSVVGMWWNTSDGMWDTVRYFSGTSYDIDYDRTGKILHYKLDEMEEAIDGKADAADLHTHTNKEVLDGITAEMVSGWNSPAEVTAADVLTKIKTVDGANSGLDADTLDGQHASAFATATQLSALETTVSGKADGDHTHNGFATSEQLSELEEVVSGKADSGHTHSNYATTAQLAGKSDSGHNHDGRYYTEDEIDDTVSTLNSAIAAKANPSDIPTKTSQLTNDSGFKTVDTNTTYSLSKSGSTITLTGSDGSTTSVTDADSNTTYGKATDTALGLVKVGYAESGKNYPVELNANGQMFVNVPWTDTNTDTNTTYTLTKSGSTIKLTGSDGSETTVSDADTNTTYGVASSSALGLVKVGFPESGKNYPVELNSANQMYVNVPWTDNNTTYGTATASTAGLVKIGFTESGKNYPVELNSSGQMFVNVPWTDNNTVYTHPTYTAKSSGLYKVTVDGTGHVSGATAVTKADITALGIPAQDTTYTLPAAGTALGGVKSGGDVTISNGTITVNDDSHAHVISNVDGLQTALDGKAASSHTHDYLPLSGGTVNGNLTVTGVLKGGNQQAYYFNSTTNSQTLGTNNATGGTNIAGGADSTCSIAGAIVKTATVLPRSTNTYYCGNANFRWKGIYSAAAVNVSSDERLKENIVKLHADEAVDFINSVDVCSFNYIGDDAEQIGVMAQDILAKAPNLAKALVTQDENGYYGVKTSDLVFPLIIAVQELTKQLKELKGE